MTMASTNQNDVQEVSRPPESPIATTSTSNQQNEVPILEDLQKRNRQRPLSLQNPTTSERTNQITTWRRSYHKDVDEALSSLLWEPYDCRESSEPDPYYWQHNQVNDQSFSSDMLSLSSVSLSSTISSCNSFCCDDVKKITTSFTDEFVEGLYKGPTYGSYSDTVYECQQSSYRFCVPNGNSIPPSFTDEFVPVIPPAGKSFLRAFHFFAHQPNPANRELYPASTR